MFVPVCKNRQREGGLVIGFSTFCFSCNCKRQTRKRDVEVELIFWRCMLLLVKEYTCFRLFRLELQQPIFDKW